MNTAHRELIAGGLAADAPSNPSCSGDLLGPGRHFAHFSGLTGRQLGKLGFSNGPGDVKSSGAAYSRFNKCRGVGKTSVSSGSLRSLLKSDSQRVETTLGIGSAEGLSWCRCAAAAGSGADAGLPPFRRYSFKARCWSRCQCWRMSA